MRGQPGFARIAHAFSGLTYLAGEPDGPPVVPGSTSLADYMSGMYGAIGALVALHARETSGEGQCIDLALYESVFRVLDEIAPAYQKLGYVRERMGADTVNVCPHSHYETKDGKWIAIACTSDAMFARLADAMAQPELASAERYGPKELRLGAREEVNRIVAHWVASLDCATVLTRCAEGGVPASLIYSIADIFVDPQYRARGNIEMTESRIGPLAVPGVVPRLSATPGKIRFLGEALGAQNTEVLHDLLGLKEDEIARLRDEGVI
jgi:crotonobetainyl-CoA:carnitine CoA-transferase CaiB-like acyl-CoA transferase